MITHTTLFALIAWIVASGFGWALLGTFAAGLAFAGLFGLATTIYLVLATR